jgi:hypothetical protein
LILLGLSVLELGGVIGLFVAGEAIGEMVGVAALAGCLSVSFAFLWKRARALRILRTGVYAYAVITDASLGVMHDEENN